MSSTEMEHKQEKKAAPDKIFASCSFSDLGLHPSVCRQLEYEKIGFKEPTLVQAEAIPVILSGRHALINAPTGTGKTVAYLAPVMHYLLSSPRKRSDGTFALVLVPTRELCMQVYEMLDKLLHPFPWLNPGYITGGENRSKQKARLRKGACILVATPGRLLDHLKNTASFSLQNLRWIIFDEADMILELGYGKEIEQILDHLGSRQNETDHQNSGALNPDMKRQNVLLSATLNEKVNHLAQISLENPVMIGFDDKKAKNSLSRKNSEAKEPEVDGAENPCETGCSLSGDYNLPSQLVQKYVKVPCGSRLVVLLSVLKNYFEKEASQKIVVFFSTCDAVDYHYQLLSNFQWPLVSQPENEVKQKFLRCKTFQLHGNMKHEERKSTFHTFNKEKMALLLCTDVAARGLDIPEVKCIIQYDSPGEATEYVHRVGRTARMGKRGDCLLFLQPVEIDYLQDLEKHGVSLREHPILKVLDSFPVHDQKHHFKKIVSLEMHPWVLSLQKALESFVVAEPDMKRLAKDAFCSWVRAYTAHRGELKRIFMVKNLHLGHVAKSFALKEQPSSVGKSFQLELKKRKRSEKQKGPLKKRKRTIRK